MIVLSVGMPRAGSGWYYNLTNDLMLASGAQDARRIRQRYRLNNILTEVNCNIGALTTRRLIAVMVPVLLGNTFVIKAHAGPSPFALRLIRNGVILPTYIYRDPRDALLSAYEHGQRGIQKGNPNAFSHLTDFETSLEFMKPYLRIWEAWMCCKQAMHTRYEDLLNDYDNEVARLVSFLRLNAQDDNVKAVIDRYRPRQPQSDQKGMHFNKGKTGRFRQKMETQQQDILAKEFGSYLERMGYPL